MDTIFGFKSAQTDYSLKEIEDPELSNGNEKTGDTARVEVV